MVGMKVMEIVAGRVTSARSSPARTCAGGSGSGGRYRSSLVRIKLRASSRVDTSNFADLHRRFSSLRFSQLDAVAATRCLQKGRRGRSAALRTSAMDVGPQNFDTESQRLQEPRETTNKLKIGIVGFGNFGQFLAERIARQGHAVLAYSRGDYTDVARKMHVSFYRDANDFCEEHPDVVLLCTSILSTEAVLTSLPMQRLKRSTLFVDVLSVKEFSKQLFLQALPPEFDVLCTHPMFGPKSGKATWAGLPFVYDKVRVADGIRMDRCNNFLDIFASEGCRMVEMSCKEHDRYAAGSQFITHTVGRVLGKLQLESIPINTKGYETLLRLVENTDADSFELYYGLFMYNPNAIDELKRLEAAFDSLKKQLFGELHDVLRHRLVNGANTRDGKLNQLPRTFPTGPASPKTLAMGYATTGLGDDGASHSNGRMKKTGGTRGINPSAFEPVLCQMSQIESESKVGRCGAQQSHAKNKVGV